MENHDSRLQLFQQEFESGAEDGMVVNEQDFHVGHGLAIATTITAPAVDCTAT